MRIFQMKKAIYGLFLLCIALQAVNATDDVFVTDAFMIDASMLDVFTKNDQSKLIFIVPDQNLTTDQTTHQISNQITNQIANQSDASHDLNLVRPASIFNISTSEMDLTNQKYTLQQPLSQKLQQNPEDVQRELAQEHDQALMNYSILKNRFYENERIRVFNYSAYSVQQLKTSLLNPASTPMDADNFYISFGYGIEFKVDKFNKIGYEYISSFPYDRGQLLRFFWVRSLNY